MSDKDEVPILEHVHDGIQEYDNPLPAWWMWSFLLTIIFGFHYWIHYEFGGGMNQKQELAADMSQIESLRKSSPAAADSEDDLQKLAGDAPTLAHGKTVFGEKCAACHGAELQGVIGPNLTDEFWIHGKGTLSDIAGVVRQGVLDKGMPAWEGLLKPDELKAVVVFIASKKGSNPANPKGPQGDKVGN